MTVLKAIETFLMGYGFGSMVGHVLSFLTQRRKHVASR